METTERRKPRARRSFTPEFKAEIMELCQRGDAASTSSTPCSAPARLPAETGGRTGGRLEVPLTDEATSYLSSRGAHQRTVMPPTERYPPRQTLAEALRPIMPKSGRSSGATP